MAIKDFNDQTIVLKSFDRGIANMLIVFFFPTPVLSVSGSCFDKAKSMISACQQTA